MPAIAASILEKLREIESERKLRCQDADFGARVHALKEYQQRRFSHTYSDLLEGARYGPAARFFLNELYGPGDFSRRDTQFIRVIPTLVRLFPNEIVDTVASLAELHSLSESLDSAMSAQMNLLQINPAEYVRAWQETGRKVDRQTQITLTLDIASRLDHLTRKPMFRHSLRLMRGAAKSAGLGELQQFLEAGFDAFRAMRGAEEFIGIVRSREQALASLLFSTRIPDASGNSAADIALIGLPP
jgi:hypothetical protein